jgi:hypothetical protein
MKGAHRTIHRVLWPALVMAVALGFALALVLRPPPEPEQTPAAEARSP